MLDGIHCVLVDLTSIHLLARARSLLSAPSELKFCMVHLLLCLPLSGVGDTEGGRGDRGEEGERIEECCGEGWIVATDDIIPQQGEPECSICRRRQIQTEMKEAQ